MAAAGKVTFPHKGNDGITSLQGFLYLRPIIGGSALQSKMLESVSNEGMIAAGTRRTISILCRPVRHFFWTHLGVCQGTDCHSQYRRAASGFLHIVYFAI